MLFVLVTAPLFPVETAKSKEVTPPPFQDVASPDSTFSEDGPAPASTSLAAPTPSPVVHRPSEVQSPRVPLTPSRPGVALQRVTSGSVSSMCDRFPRLNLTVFTISYAYSTDRHRHYLNGSRRS